MSAELTPWFDGEVKPAYVGAYERKIPNCNMTAYWYWDGMRWDFGGTELKDVKPIGSRSYDQYLPWRGLASDPSTKVSP